MLIGCNCVIFYLFISFRLRGIFSQFNHICRSTYWVVCRRMFVVNLQLFQFKYIIHYFNAFFDASCFFIHKTNNNHCNLKKTIVFLLLANFCNSSLYRKQLNFTRNRKEMKEKRMSFGYNRTCVSIFSEQCLHAIAQNSANKRKIIINVQKT